MRFSFVWIVLCGIVICVSCKVEDNAAGGDAGEDAAADAAQDASEDAGGDTDADTDADSDTDSDTDGDTDTDMDGDTDIDAGNDASVDAGGDAGDGGTGGLIAHWPLDGDANDVANGDYDGTVTGAVPTEGHDGAPNSAYLFNGTTDVIDCEAPIDVSSNALTVSAWIKFGVDPAAITQARSYFVDSVGSFRFWYAATADNTAVADQIFWDLWDWNGISTTGVTWTMGTWYHLVGTFDGTTARVYVDGTLNNSAAATKTLHSATASFLIGAGLPWTGYPPKEGFFNGAIDDVRIYDRALSDTEVLALYNE
ncbi:MAG: LamG domain-containing protein [Deltaproteobacteria bacterium]|nr:LamG domain-containing protein [Deltaproteobacteria bacterium]